MALAITLPMAASVAVARCIRVEVAEVLLIPVRLAAVPCVTAGVIAAVWLAREAEDCWTTGAVSALIAVRLATPNCVPPVLATIVLTADRVAMTICVTLSVSELVAAREAMAP